MAITKGRYIRPEELHICWQARLMNRFVPGAGSMASIYGMQVGASKDKNTNIMAVAIDKDIPSAIPVSYTHLDVYKRQVLTT